MKPYGVKRHWNAVDDYCEKFRRTRRKWRKLGRSRGRAIARMETKKALDNERKG